MGLIRAAVRGCGCYFIKGHCVCVCVCVLLYVRVIVCGTVLCWEFLYVGWLVGACWFSVCVCVCVVGVEGV